MPQSMPAAMRAPNFGAYQDVGHRLQRFRPHSFHPADESLTLRLNRAREGPHAGGRKRILELYEERRTVARRRESRHSDITIRRDNPGMPNPGGECFVSRG
jgi:hypothetical protein